MMVGRYLTLRCGALILLLPIARLGWAQADIGSDYGPIAGGRHWNVGGRWIGSYERDQWERNAFAPNQQRPAQGR